MPTVKITNKDGWCGHSKGVEVFVSDDRARTLVKKGFGQVVNRAGKVIQFPKAKQEPKPKEPTAAEKVAEKKAADIVIAEEKTAEENTQKIIDAEKGEEKKADKVPDTPA